ncbi:NUDIX hydrolase [Solobacterium moorei]|uniref:NUDIX domain-containing protein n=1 Tax=Solobacterium moorei TaxID=102148 RepID=UPI0023F491AA|nr:NUDIX hydrolase [Solobacterium moorei]
MNRLLTREEIFEGNILHVYKDTVEIEDNLTVEREVVQHIGGVGIALEDKDGKFFFVKQWRYAQQEETLEFPAGKKEEGEDSLTTAKREIQEETGYTGKDWIYMGKIYPTPAYDTEVIDLYYAKVDQYIGQHLDKDEKIQIYKYRLEELIELIMEGKIPDAKTVSMAMYLCQMKKRGEI